MNMRSEWTHVPPTDVAHACDWCGLPFTQPARDECVNPEHRASDVTLGLREASCGCCVIVDATALNLLRDDSPLVAAIAAECDKAEQRSRDGKETGGLVPAPVLRRLLGEVR